MPVYNWNGSRAVSDRVSYTGKVDFKRSESV